MSRANGAGKGKVAWMLVGLMLGAPLALPLALPVAEAAIVPPPTPTLPLESRIAALRSPDAIVVPAETLPASLVPPAASTKANLVDVDARTIATGETVAQPPAWPAMPGAMDAADQEAPTPPAVPPAPAVLEPLDLPAPPWPLVPVAFGEPGADVATPPNPAMLQAAVDAATYGACGQALGGAVVCAPVEVPFGVPIPLDIDQNPGTGVGGMDVIVQVTPRVVADLARVPTAPPAGLPALPGADDLARVASAPGLAVALQVRVLPSATDLPSTQPTAPFVQRALAARVWATYSVAEPGQPGQLLVTAGVDATRAPAGAAPRLPMVTDAQLTLEDLPRLLQGQALANLDITFQGPSPEARLFASWEKTGPGASGPATVSAVIAPAAPVRVDVDAMLDGSEAMAVVSAPDRPVFTLGYDAVKGSTQTHVGVTFDPLPTQLTATYADLGGGATRLAYDAAQVVPEVRVAYDRVTSTIRTQGAVTLQGLPRQFSVVLHMDASTGAFDYDAGATIPRVYGTYIRTGSGANVVASVDLRQLPPAFHVAWDTAAGSVAFDGAAPIGSVSGRVSVNGGAVTWTDPRDHVIATRQGSALGLDFRLTGLKGAAAVDTTDGGRYTLDFSPGGQPFLGAADLDGLSARVELSALPGRISVDLRGGASCYAHDAGGAVAEVRARVERASTGLLGAMRLVDLPAQVNLCWTGAGSATYTASTSLRQVHAFVRAATNGATFEALVDSLPPYMALAFDASGARFDARASAGAAPGSSQVGSIQARFGSAGRFLVGAPAEDHAVLRTVGTGTQGDLLYRGLRSVEVTQAAGTLHVALVNTGPRLFLAGIHTPTAAASLLVDQVPATLTADVGPKVVQVQASQPIALLDADLEAGSVLLGATVAAVPASMRLDLDPAAQTAAWSASAPIPAIVVQGRALNAGRIWDARLELTGVPATWDASFASGHVRFRGLSAPLGNVAAWVTNHATATTYAGNHASVILAANGDLDASLAMAQVALVEYEKAGSGFRADLRMGGGGRFYVHGAAVVGTSAARADVVIDALPTSLQLSQAGDAFAYNANANFDLHATAQLGHASGIAAAPAAPLVRGLSARDGYGCAGTDCGKGWKASLFLQGFPKALSANARSTTFGLTEFRPPAGKGYLVLDVDMTARDSPTSAPPRARLLAVQQGIPSPLTATFGPLTVSDRYARECTDRLPIICLNVYQGRATTFAYAASGALGPLMADAVQGALSARVELSAIPSSVSVDILEGKQTSTATIAMSQGIGRVFAGAKASTADASFAGGVELRQVPAAVQLSFGRIADTNARGERFTVPGLSYQGSAAGLDINAWVDATLMGGDLRARAMLGIVDLAPYVTLTMSGDELDLRSRPRACAPLELLCPYQATGEIEAHVWADLDAGTSGSGCLETGDSGCDGNRVEWSYRVDLPISIDDLTFRVTDVTRLDIAPGFITAVAGDYATFTFGWEEIHVAWDILARVAAYSTFGQVGSATITESGGSTVNVDFLKFHASSRRYCAVNNVLEVEVRPDYSSKSTNAFTLTRAAPPSGGKWLIMPLPAGVMDGSTWEVRAAELLAAKTYDDGLFRVIVANC